MKILWLSHLIPYPPKAGVIHRSYNLIKQLSQAHDIHILAFNQEALIANMYDDIETGTREAIEQLEAVCDEIVIVDLPQKSYFGGKYALALKSLVNRLPYSVLWLQSSEYRVALAELMQKTSFDIIHFDTISLSQYHSDVKSIPCVLNHHNVESHLLLRRATRCRNIFEKAFLSFEGRKLQYFEELVYSDFELHLFCSELDERRMKSFCHGMRSAIVPNGVDMSNCDVAQQQFDQRLLFLGTLDWEPNRRAVDFIVLEIWPLIRERCPDVVFDLVGANPPRSAIRLSMSDSRFRVHGFVDNVEPFFNSGGIFVCPITDGGGTKLKLLDALAMGMPTIAHPIACEGLDVVPERDLLTATSAEEFANTIERLLFDSKLRAKLSKSGEILVKSKYDYKLIGEHLSSMYMSIAANAEMTG